MTIVLWLRGLLTHRAGRLIGGAASLALSVALVGSLVSFLHTSRSTLTARAAASVPVDWQVQVGPHADVEAVRTALARVPHLRALLPVRIAAVPGFSATTAQGVRETGRAFVVSLPDGYAAAAPDELRFLVGARSGVLLVQQTAANLDARPGDVVTVRGSGKVRVDGVVDMPAADSFFQVVGAPPGAGATAPPDNVLLVPPADFGRLTRGATVVTQFHVRFDRVLPSDPASAATVVTRTEHRFEADVAGSALVGDNLAAALGAAREDALYATLLFLLLGLPAIAMAVLVAVLVAGVSADQRRREVDVLRLRGASPRRVLGFAVAEALVVAVPGVAVGLLVSRANAYAAAVGVALALATIALPAWLRSRSRHARLVSSVQQPLPRTRRPWVLRAYVDVVCLAIAGVVGWLTARGHYQVVVVPEGLPVTSINYAALLGPAFAWPGLALLVWRVSDLLLGRRTGRFSRVAAPELVAAAVRRRRYPVARGAAALAVVLGLAAASAIFTTTYQAQSRLDAQLTVGADVTVTEPVGAAVPPAYADTLRRVPGVRAVEPLLHRFTYVGADLQDLYGIRPDHIRDATSLRDSFVRGARMADLLRALATTPDGVLLAQETVSDYQLHRGDLIRLRVQTGPDRVYRPVPFHVVGVVLEFPTAPKDSFVVANMSYLQQVTGNDSAGAFLVRTPQPRRVATALRALAPATRVDDIVTGRRRIGAGLAATDLSGLARIELGFGALLALVLTGLTLALGILDRRPALAVLAALGATARQRAAFLRAESRAVVAGGIAGGAVVAVVMAWLLVKVLTGIFDPPPTGLDLPWGYLLALPAGVVAAAALATAALGRIDRRAAVARLRGE